MSTVVSTLRRMAGNGWVQDICGMVAIALFIATATYAAACLSALVTLWRLGQ